ncbi:hypothetical protein C3Y93_08205 [Acinetobacter sp. SWBY1]|nr:hypothetical protein C3Y93_08205 [Acinetobacter sp. SWBY1]
MFWNSISGICIYYNNIKDKNSFIQSQAIFSIIEYEFQGNNSCFNNYSTADWKQKIAREILKFPIFNLRNYGGVSKSMLTLNEAIIDVKKG